MNFPNYHYLIQQILSVNELLKCFERLYKFLCFILEQTRFSLPPTKFIPSASSSNNENTLSNFWSTNSQSTVSNQAKPTTSMSITDAFDSNLSALVQSNHPINPFSPYGYSIAAHAQSPDTNSRQSSFFTPKRGTNPFDDDLIRR